MVDTNKQELIRLCEQYAAIGEMVPIGHGWIDPLAAIDLLNDEPLELIDAFKKHLD